MRTFTDIHLRMLPRLKVQGWRCLPNTWGRCSLRGRPKSLFQAFWNCVEGKNRDTTTIRTNRFEREIQLCIYQLWKKTSQGQIPTRDVTQHWFLESLCLHQPHWERATFKTRLTLADTSQTHHSLSTQMHHAKEASLYQSHVRSRDTTISVISRDIPLNTTDGDVILGRETLKKPMLVLYNHKQEASAFSKEMKALFHLHKNKGEWELDLMVQPAQKILM